jgi:RNase P/RNase MRP subunit p30
VFARIRQIVVDAIVVDFVMKLEFGAEDYPAQAYANRKFHLELAITPTLRSPHPAYTHYLDLCSR